MLSITHVTSNGIWKLKKGVNDLIWKFIWDNKPNQIERSVCCLNISEGEMGMINIDNFVKSKEIQYILKKKLTVRWTRGMR